VLAGFAALAGGDAASARLREAAGGELDLAIGAHRRALLAWLRAWGCRHLRVADTRRSSRSLASWWGRHGGSLPGRGRPLVVLSRREVDHLAAAFGDLASAPAAWRATPGGRASVTFGQTAAAKALFAIRPMACAPWDAPIRDALGLRGAEGYGSYLEQVGGWLLEQAGRLGVPVAALPAALGRPGSTPPRLVDELLWMRVNRPGVAASAGASPAVGARG
jgi:hypothetical protein